MEKNEIDIYLHTILKKQLQKFKISNYGLYSILNNVGEQLKSIIKNWQDPEFLDAIFTTVIEEGHFYEPHINDRIGCLVVLGIRNSLLEIAASVNYKEYGLKKDLKENDIKWITSTAIEYFKEIDLDALCQKIDLENDYYKDIAKKYEVAYQALIELGKCTEENQEKEFPKIQKEPYILKEVVDCEEKANIKEKVKDTANGIQKELTPGITKLLKSILEEESSMIYVDSFKYLSRNLETILKVLEFLLTHNAVFLTNNFFLENGYVSKRKYLIRASHQEDFNREAMKTIEEVSPKYQEELKQLASQLEENK